MWNPLHCDWPSLLRHPLFIALIQLVVAAAIAFLLTERWQRWRQRRDFQYQALSKFSDVSNRTQTTLVPLTDLRAEGAKIPNLDATRDELLHLNAELLEAGNGILVAYGWKSLVEERATYTKEIQALTTMLFADEPLAVEEYQVLRRSAMARRRLILTVMQLESKLLSSREFLENARRLELRIVRDQDGSEVLPWWQYVLDDKMRAPSAIMRLRARIWRWVLYLFPKERR